MRWIREPCAVCFESCFHSLPLRAAAFQWRRAEVCDALIELTLSHNDDDELSAPVAAAYQVTGPTLLM